MAGSRPTTRNGSASHEESAPSDVPEGSWTGALRRTFSEFRRDNLTDLAAALTYYGILSIFPAILVLLSLLGFAGQSATRALTDSISAAPSDVAGFLTATIENMQGNQAAAGIFGLIGLALALWSASGYIAAFMRASNVVYDVPEGRPVYKTLPIRAGVTLLMVVLLTAAAVAVVVSGGLAEQAGRLLGLGSAAVTVWRIAKWPVLLLVALFAIAVLYWASPNARRGFRWVSPGSVLAVVIWLLASGAFAFYVANFASYSNTYGSMATVIIFLVWLWITNVAILLGEEFNSEIQRGRALAGGLPEGEEPYVEMRNVPKRDRRAPASGPSDT